MLKSTARGSGLFRFFATSRVLAAPKVKKTPEQLRALQKRAEKREAVAARNARRPAVENPLYMPVPTALRYLRAAEVGRPTNEAVITLQVRVVSRKGDAPLQGSIKFARPLTDTQILVFASDEAMQQTALAAGARMAGGKELVDKIAAGEIDLSAFDRAIATPDMVAALRPVARNLGPKGLMPAPKRGTVVDDVTKYIEDNISLQPFRQRNDHIALKIGRCDFSDEDLLKNVIAVSEAVKAAVAAAQSKSPTILGQTVLSTTHGPGIVIDF
ncbi:hypothetical protein KL950_002150 [Ogataea haglerorum]|nr:hypothetical protein KL950_002150 [Ogataea haglerorum]